MQPLSAAIRQDLALRLGPETEALRDYERLRSAYLAGFPLSARDLDRLRELYDQSGRLDYLAALADARGRQPRPAPPPAASPRAQAVLSQIDAYLATNQVDRASHLLELARNELGPPVYDESRARVDLALVKELLHAETTDEPVAADLRDALRRDLSREAYEPLLASLRRLGPSPIPSPTVAYMFGRAWAGLGRHDVAAQLYDLAYQATEKPHFAVLALDAIAAASLQDARRRIDRLEGSPDAPSAVLLRAACWLHHAALQEADPSERDHLFARVVALVERSRTDDSVLPSIVAAADLAAAYSCEHLGKDAAALDHFNRAVQIYPHDVTFVARGLTRMQRGDRPGALGDFRRAIGEGCSLVHPFVFLAHDALDHQSWRRARELAKQGLWREPSPTVRAQLLEWMAIAEANLDGDVDDVLALFDRAIASDPFAPTISRNRDAFVAWKNDRASPTWDAKEPDPAAFREALEAATPRNVLLAA
ncbi:MAG: hypothetical protein R3B72_46875 [Polyangiaceae bacterium]